MYVCVFISTYKQREKLFDGVYPFSIVHIERESQNNNNNNNKINRKRNLVK